jgi:hypothetical protein
MDESADNGQGDENPERKAVKPELSETGSGEHQLPVVWSPSLHAGPGLNAGPSLDAEFGIEDESVMFVDADMPPHETAQAEMADEEAGGTKASATPTRSSRFVILAASVAIAAAVGSITGSLTATGIGGLMAASAEPSADKVEANSILKALKSELAELNAVKASLDSSSHYANAQFAAISDRLTRVEHAQTDPAQFAHIADTIDRLNKLNTAAPETTGSIATPAPGAPAAPTQAKATDRLLEDWVLEDVHGDRALVASRYGGEFLVTPGSVLPGLGQVDAVKRQDGQWVVVTAHGLITEGR